MNCFLYTILSLILMFSPFFGNGQEVDFKHLSINDGLSQNAVFAITQDRDGFMWFGTKDGLNKYDGYSFKVYQHDPNNPTSVSANYITALYADAAGNLWIGTENGILNRYQKNRESFQRNALPLTNTMGKNSSEIKEINEDENGTIWVGTSNNGLFKVPLVKNEVDENAIEQYQHNETEILSLSNNMIRGLYADKSGNLWIGTNKGLNRMHIDTKEFESFYFDIKHPEAPDSNRDLAVTAIYSNEDGFLWLGTLSGLIHFNTTNYSYRVFPHHFAMYRYGWGEITEIVEGAKGNFWLASSGELMFFDTKTKTYTSHKNDPHNPNSLSYNSVSSVHVDKSNLVWIGTTGMGINYHDPKAHRFSLLKRKGDENSRITGFSVRAILEENDRYVWISSDVLYRWDRKRNELKSYENDPNFLDAFGNTGAWSMIKSRDGNLWFATTEGLYVYNYVSGTTKQFKYHENNPDGIPQKNVFSVFEDNAGYLWIATENYLSKMTDRKNGIFNHYQYQKGPANNVFERPVLYQDMDDKFWLGTKNGLLVFDEKKENFHTYRNNSDSPNSLIDNHIKCIYPDPEAPEKLLWIGTSGGLDLFDKENETFTHVTHKDGLPNNMIYGILSDPQNNLWISTNKGISKYNPQHKTFRNFDIHDGLQSNEFNTGAYFKSDKGELFFGGIQGVSHFFPEQILDNPFIPSVALTGIKVFNKSTKESEENSFTSIPIIEKEPLIFTHQDDIITMEFAALDFSSPAKNQYAYKLENFHNDWIKINNTKSVTFTNLPPGKYIFKVKASNNDGVWNEAGISIPIKVLPHWSGTWWAFTSYFILFLLLLYAIRKYELKGFNIQNQLKMERIETESLRGLDKLKSGFFTNISHEFRTPLSLISGQTESLLGELKSKQARKQIKTIDTNAKRLLQLINQLLDISKLESCKMELHTSQNNLVLFLKNLFYSFESFAAKKNIELLFSSESKNIQAVFDAEKMEKIIVNILANSIKFTPNGGTVHFQIDQKQRETITISISDTGIGVSEKDLPYIFDRFYQGDHSDTRAFEGTGIGLALVRELVSLHRGNIRAVNNNTGLGTSFIIEIPVGDIERSLIENSAVPRIIEALPAPFVNGNSKIELPQLNKKIILVVEDNADIRQFIREQLQHSYKVVEAENGMLGLELAKQSIPDVILIDIMMPVMDGYSMVARLKMDEKTSHIPVIMLTGKASQEDKITGLLTGVDVYLTKPFSTKELHIRIANLIKQCEQLKARYKNMRIVSLDTFQGTSVDQQFLEKVLFHLKQNLCDPGFSVEALADKMCLSSSQLHRKFHALIDQAPGQLLRNMRLQKAAQLIREKAGSIAEISFQTGFNDQAYFSRAFKNEFGCSPSAYKKENA